MKYNNTQPSTDPSAAMNAYNGIRAGRCMESLMSSRSLIIGNVSTEESRKEIRKSPGAPSPPANAPTFCFHPLKLVAKSNSSKQFAATRSGVTFVLCEAERRARAAIAQRQRDRNDS